MPNGMSSGPVGEAGNGFSLTQNADERGVSSIHKVPTEQFIHELDDHGNCLCGPQISYQNTGRRVVPLVLHFALDRGYYWMDWGPDGPE